MNTLNDTRIWALVFAIMAVPLLAMRQSFLLRSSHGLTPMEFVITVGAVVIVAMGVVGKLRLPTIPVAPTLAVSVATLTYLCSYAAAAARGTTATAQISADRALITAAISTAAYFAIVSMIRTRSGVVLILRGLVIGGTLSACYALLQTATGFDIAPYVRVPILLKGDTHTLVTGLMRAGSVRPQGAAGHPLELGAILTTLVPLGIGVILDARRRAVRVWPWAVATAIILLGALATVSRSVVVGLAVTAVVFAIFSPPRRTLTALVSVVSVAVFAFLLGLPLLRQLAEVASSGTKDDSLQSRSFGANYVWHHFTGHLWFGQGLGTYDLTKQPVLDNEYLSRLSEVGIVGLGGFIAILAVGVISGLVAATVARRQHDRDGTDLAASVTAAIASIVTVAIILDISGFAQISMMLSLLVPLAVVLARRALHGGV